MKKHEHNGLDSNKQIIPPIPENGWAVDADTMNQPYYPMKKLTDIDHSGMVWSRPAQQKANVEILSSNERPHLTAVFGTSHPPAGLSGVLRRFAFRYSEGSLGHWMPLLLADRVNVVEGIFEDLLRGHIPNVFSEMGLRAAWKHNRRGLIKTGMGIVVAVSLVATILHRRRG